MPRHCSRRVGQLTLMWTVLVVAGVAHPQNSQVPKPMEYLISSDRLDCLRRNAAVYRSSTRQPLFIPLADCPILPNEPFFGALRNEGPTTIEPGSARVDSFLVVSKQEFECLIRPNNTKAKVYRFFPESCRLEFDR